MKKGILLLLLLLSNISSAQQRVDLISSSNCELQRYYLINCRFNDTTLFASDTSSVIPVRPRFEVVFEPAEEACITNISRMLHIIVPGNPEAEEFSYLSKKKMLFRAELRKPISSLTLKDATPPLPATFPSNCHIYLNVFFNEPDIYGKKEAEDLIFAIKYRLEKKEKERDRYKELLQFAGAYYAVDSLLNDLYTKLTNESAQRIRDNLEQLTTLVMSCYSVLSPDERHALLELYEASAVMSNPNAFKDPSGNPLSLNDYIKNSRPAIALTLGKIREKLNDGKLEEYKNALREAEREVERIKIELSKMEQQIASLGF